MPEPSLAPINLKPLAAPGTSTPNAMVSTQKQPLGREGVAFSLAQVARIVAEGQGDPLVVAFARRAVRDAGRPDNVLGKAKAIYDAMKKQKIEWVLDPVRREFMAKAKYFMPSAEGKDDALLVLGDCDELTVVYLTLFLESLESVGVESGAVLGHSYSASKQLSHVLAAVHDGRQWVRVDPSGDWEFGQFKQPTWETMISVPSCKLICNGPLCASGPRAPKPVKASPEMEFVSLEGLSSEDAQSARLVDSFQPTDEFFSLALSRDTSFTHDGTNAVSALGAIDEGSGLGDGGTPGGDIFGAAEAQAVADLITTDVMGVTQARDDLLVAYGTMMHLFTEFGIDPKNNPYGWNADLETDVDKAVDAASLFAKAGDDALMGQRRVAMGDESEGYIIELLPSDAEKLISDGKDVFLVNALQAQGTTSGLSAGALALVIVGVGLVAGAFAIRSIAEYLEARQHTLQIEAKLAQQKAEYDLIYQCAEKKDPAICQKLHQTVGDVQVAQEQAAAEKERQIAAQKAADAEKEKWSMGKVIAASIGAIALGGAGMYVAKKNGLI
jgi:hypothetical protein